MEIKEYREINKGCLKSAFTLVMDLYNKMGSKCGTQEVDCVYFEKENGNFWINAGAKEYVSSDGTKKSYNMIRWDKETAAALNKCIRDKIKNKEVLFKARTEEEIEKAAPFVEDLPF